MKERDKVIRRHPQESRPDTGDILSILQEDIIIPDIVQKKAEAAFEAVRKEQVNEERQEKSGEKRAVSRRRRMTKKQIGLLVSAAVLAAGAVTAGAAAYMKWSKSLSQGMQASDEMQRKLEDVKMVVPVNKTSVCNGITVTAEQSIVDNYYAQIIFRVEGYQPPEGEQPAFENLSVTVDDYEPTKNFDTPDYDETKDFREIGNFYDGLIAGEDGRAVRADGTIPADTESLSKYVQDDGSLEYIVTLSNSMQKGIFLNKPVHIELKNIGTVGKAEYFPDLEGTWTFDWILTGSEEMRVYDLDAPVGDTGAKVIHAEISPISLHVTYLLPREVLGSHNDDPAWGGYPFSMPGVKMKDGTVYSNLYLGPGSLGYLSEESDEYFTAFPIDRILDVSQVEALIVKNMDEDGDFYVIPLDE